MSLITENQKSEKEAQELVKAWSKLRLIPEYIQDYKLSIKSNLSTLEQQRIKETWGFCPLSDPEKDISFEFQCAFSDYDEKVSRFLSPLNWNGLDCYSVRNGKLYDPNNYFVKALIDFTPNIKLEVDLTKPITVLVKQFKEDVQYFQKMLKIMTENTRTHDHLDYLTKCLLKTGLKESEIKRRLKPKPKKSKDEDEKFNAADTEAIRRRIKKHKKV